MAVLAGRFMPATICAGLGGKAPHLLRKLAKVDKIMRAKWRRAGLSEGGR
jgi:hypothetical protein